MKFNDVNSRRDLILEVSFSPLTCGESITSKALLQCLKTGDIPLSSSENA
jgi:hypothetical protein